MLNAWGICIKSLHANVAYSLTNVTNAGSSLGKQMYTVQLQIVCNSWTVAARELLHGACEGTVHKTQ